MKVGLSWLREHVELPVDVTAEQLDEALNNLGIEVENIVDLRETVRGDLVIGRVISIEELTGFKKPIRYCLVDVGKANGTGAPQEIVCGAINFAAGDLVVVILPGGVLPGNFQVGERKTYGRMSRGMICSVRELGTGDDHDGILVLSDDLAVPTCGAEAAARPAPGDDARPHIGLHDIVLELEITPDRGYQMSVRGIARELAHWFEVPFTDAGLGPRAEATTDPAWPVAIEDTAGCDRFAARLVRGVDPSAPTPEFMQRRLATAGIRTLGLAIDITNYVMVELGQPMHAFDAERLQGGLVVRRAHAGEELTTLDAVRRKLSPDDMVICDDSGPISLAAVMGGQTSEVVAGTTQVLFEAAHWDPVMVGRTARRHKLFSEAAKRWERGVDRELPLVAIERAVSLLTEYGGGRAAPEILDLNHPPRRAAIAMSWDRPSRLIGVDYPEQRISGLLSEVGCDVAGYDDHVEVIAPSWRPDLREAADLVEEIVRLDGFGKVPSVLPPAPSCGGIPSGPPGNGLTAEQRRRRSIGRTLAEQGYVEVLCYPFVSRAALTLLGAPGSDASGSAVRLANPISEEEPYLRTGLLPGLITALRRNLGRGHRDVAIYEQGLVFLPRRGAAAPPAMGADRPPSKQEWQAANAAVPAQPWCVAAVLTGDYERPGWWGGGRKASWADAVQAARDVIAVAAPDAELDVTQLVCHPFHPGRCASFTVLLPGGQRRGVGMAGELHPAVCDELDLPRGTSAMELTVDALPLPGTPPPPVLSSYPPALIDVALVLAEEVPAAQVEQVLAEGAGGLLESVRLFDVYTGAGVAKGKRSLAYSMTFRAPDRTLTVDEAVAARDAAVAAAGQRFGAVLRGS